MSKVYIMAPTYKQAFMYADLALHINPRTEMAYISDEADIAGITRSAEIILIAGDDESFFMYTGDRYDLSKKLFRLSAAGYKNIKVVRMSTKTRTEAE